MGKERYPFRDDEGNVHSLTFEQMMEWSANGIATLPDGNVCRRMLQGNIKSTKKPAERTEIVSDALGFSALQLTEMQDHLRCTGIKGVEFVQDKTEGTFMRVKCDSPRVLQRYMQSRGFHDQNSRNGSGAMLTEKDFCNAKELVLRNHG